MAFKKENDLDKSDKLNRRDFFKVSANTGVGAAAVLAGVGEAKAALKPQSKKTFSLFR